MSLLATVTWSRRAGLVLNALAVGGAKEGKVLVLGSPGLARVLAARGREVESGRVGAGDEEKHDADTFAALVAVTRSEPTAEWSRVVRKGGVVVVVASAVPDVELSRRALCAGWTDVRAARTGRTVVISGRIFKI